MTQAPITAGTYLRLRREAAGFSLRDVATHASFHHCAFAPFTADAAELMLAGAEIDSAVLDATMLARLRLFLPLDAQIYANLVAGLPTPPVCSGCGCSWHDPCRGAAGPCAWADAEATICTRCIRAVAA